MFSYGGRRCEDPHHLFDQCADKGHPTEHFAGKANRVQLNSGAEPSAGSLLMRYGDLKLVDPANAHTLTFSDNSNHAIALRNFYLKQAVRVVGGADADDESVYLLDVVDSRSRLRMVPVSKAYNLRLSDGSGYQTPTTNSGTPWTWAGLVGDLWAAVGGLGTFPGLPFTPNATPENFNFFGGYALAAMVTVLRRIGCDLQHDHEADTFKIVRAGDTTYTFTDWTGDRKFDGAVLFPPASNRPEKVRVRFTRYPTPGGGTDPYHFVDVSLSTAAGVLAGSVVVVEDDLAALGATGTPSNSSALATRAAERAADWERVYSNLSTPKVVQYREYTPAVRGSVGVRRSVVVYSDLGDGYTTEAYSVSTATPPPSLFPIPSSAFSISTRNVDGTEIGETTGLNFNQSTGVQITQAAGHDVVFLRSASATQMGAVSVGPQIFQGAKHSIRNASFPTFGTHFTNLCWLAADQTNGSVQNVFGSGVDGYGGVYAGQEYAGVLPRSVGLKVISSAGPSFPYVGVHLMQGTPASGDRTSVVRAYVVAFGAKQTNGFFDTLAGFAVISQDNFNSVPTVMYGIDHNLLPGQTGIFRGGILVGFLPVADAGGT